MIAASAPALELRNVHVSLGHTAILNGINLAIAAGERVALIGPNGAGKSTLFNVISGRIAPSQGQVWLQGQRIDGLPPHVVHRAGLGRSFQITHIFPNLSVRDNVRCAVLWSLGYRYSFWRRLSRLRDVNERTQQVLAQIQLSDRQDVLAASLSYAEQRALELGMTLASDAPVLLLDEPTAGMSHSETRHFVALIRELTAGKSLLTVEHDMGVVFELADRIAVLAQGEIIACDTPEKVRANVHVQEAYLGTTWAGGTQPSF